MDDQLIEPGSHDKPGVEASASLAAALAEVEQALRGLRFGSVTVIVHDSTVVQIERTDRRRLRRHPR